MAVIALAGINYKNWLKFIAKPVFIMLSIGAVAIVIAIQIGYH
jgi:uncharacterized ion transporter superfamily protein YfcC